MKRTLLLLTILLTISCTKQGQDFRGIADFKIGADFNSVPNAEKFTNVMPNEYNMRTYKLSHKIGSVSDLNITTENGKISEVKFTSNENTNTAALDEATDNMIAVTFSDVERAKSKINLESVKFYTTADSTIFYVVIYKNKNFRNGNAKNEYHYSSKDFQLKKTAQVVTQFKSQR